MSGPALYDIAKISRSCFLNYNRKFKAQFKNLHFYKNQSTHCSDKWQTFETNALFEIIYLTFRMLI